jgi:hypothetical protein
MASQVYGLVPDYGVGYFNGLESDKTIWTSEKGITDEVLYEVLKKSPEVVGVIRILINDVLSDKWKFLGSKSAQKTAETTEIETNFYKVLADGLYDLFLTGDMYLLKLRVNKDDFKVVLSSKIDSNNFLLKSKMEKDKLIEYMFENYQEKYPKDFSRTRSLQLLKSSTVRGVYDKNGNVIRYIQRVGLNKVEFSPEDIIHISLANIGGSVTGFTPVMPLLSDIGTLIEGKEYMGKIFEAVNPPIIYNLPDSTAGEDDRNYQLLRKTLKDLQEKKNKLKSIITTGKIETKEVRQFSQDVEVQLILKQFTSIILFAWGMPAHKVPFVLEKGSLSPKEADEGYFKQIDHIQNILELKLNKELWSEVNVRMQFNRSYRIDELREANICAIMWDRNAMTIEEGRDRLGLQKEIPTGQTLPIHMKQQSFNFFNPVQDKKIQGGDTTSLEENNNTPQSQDNKVKTWIL